MFEFKEENTRVELDEKELEAMMASLEWVDVTDRLHDDEIL